MSIQQSAFGRFLEPIVINLVAQGDYAAYSVVNVVWNETLNQWEGTQVASSSSQIGPMAVIQDATTATTRSVRAVVRGDTKIKTDLDSYANGVVLVGSSSGDVTSSADNGDTNARVIGFITDKTNDKIWFDGNSI